MSPPRDVSPSTLPIELTADGISVEYLDGREVFYHGVPSAVEDSITTSPGKHVQVLVTDPDETQGVLIYVNDLNTDAEILEETGVGRIALSNGETATPFPGVEISQGSMRVTVEADIDTVGGRVFVFEEDELGERSFEIVENS